MIRFETEAYFKDIGVSSFFYPYVEVGKCNKNCIVNWSQKVKVSWAYAKPRGSLAEPAPSSTFFVPYLHFAGWLVTWNKNGQAKYLCPGLICFTTDFYVQFTVKHC